jgi:FKBP-type peptidyl-prolyl cis-trans isomerase
MSSTQIRHWLLVMALPIALAAVGCEPSQPPAVEAPAAPPTEVQSEAVEESTQEDAAVEAARTLGTPSENEIVTTESGLRYIDISVGEGEAAKAGDTAVVHYTGWLVNGTKFDSSVDRGEPFSFPLGAGRVIRGWDEGVDGMMVGGVRKLIVSPELGYGSRSIGPIPPDSTLIFEVQLLEIQ